MSRYMLRRLLLMIPLLLGITFCNFIFINAAPGDPITAMIDPMELVDLTEAQIQARREALGLDKPLVVRYALWLVELAQGNLGYSIVFKRPVAALLLASVRNTFVLMLSALVISTFVGISLGIISALRPYSKLDYGLTVFAFAGVAIPDFFLALLLIYLVSVKAGLLPTSGMMTPGADPSVLDRLRYMILPVIALAYPSIGSLLRFARGSMLEVLREDYINTARAKGLGRGSVILRHALTNALLPVVTIVGLRIPALFGGAIIIEAIFNWPGVGTLMLSAVSLRDYPLLMGGLFISALFVLGSNLLADLTYGMVDPRIRYE